MDLHPNQYHQSLTQERLEKIAERLLQAVNTTLESHTDKFDDGYTRGSCFFGRAKNSLLDMAQNTDWMDLAKDGNDITPTIGEVPFRFAREHDVDSPKKRHISRQSHYEAGQFELAFPDQISELATCRFYIQAPLSHKGDMDEAEELSDSKIIFAGFNLYEERLFSWEYRKKVRTLHVIDSSLPEAVEAPEPRVFIPKDDSGEKTEMSEQS
ncbi:hypothetical protein [Endozoicomonas lisbonensis]|uniref:Uncharacterized protein n=1 Tax=Endozoicomonas lisbonensis TaxID=3120522 RepID=A0ABV2SFJ2_9GAMM